LWTIHVPGVENLDSAIVKTLIRIGHAGEIVETIIKGIGNLDKNLDKNLPGVIPYNLIFTIARNRNTIHEMIETMILIEIQGLPE